MADSTGTAETIARHALRTGGSFSLKVTRCHVTAKFKKYGAQAIVVSDSIDQLGTDADVEGSLRALLRRVEYALNVSPLTPLTDPVDSRDFVVRLTSAQRAQLVAMITRYRQFKAEVVQGWHPADLEPCLASPRSSLQPCPEMNQCGAED